MRPKDKALAVDLRHKLKEFSQSQTQLIGIDDPVMLDVLIEQLIESIHRVRYVPLIGSRKISDATRDPSNEAFDPLKAAVLWLKDGDVDEACWLVFLFVHFGKHIKGGWRYVRETYGRLNTKPYWSWHAVIADVNGFRTWLDNNMATLRRSGSGFGNHRKYQSFSATKRDGTGAAVESYVAWVSPPRTHAELFESALIAESYDAKETFHALFTSMGAVRSFGRTARFDYLTMIGKLGIVAIEPGSPYLVRNSGPTLGASLLLRGSKNLTDPVKSLETVIVQLDASLLVGMQVLEDALCNWQKSPKKMIRFRG